MKDDNCVLNFLSRSEYQQQSVSVFLEEKLASISTYITMRGMEYFDKIDENGDFIEEEKVSRKNKKKGVK